jgi:hypothetical protein
MMLTKSNKNKSDDIFQGGLDCKIVENDFGEFFLIIQLFSEIILVKFIL